MNLTTTAQAIILLTSYFGKQDKDAAKPLTNAEWARFAMWLRGSKLSPADLLDNNKKALLSQWRDPKNKITQERVEALLKRGHSMALALEKWSRSGLWVITRADKDNYPKRLLLQLGNQAPPVLYGCGDKALLKAGGIAVVGSRNASPSDLAYAEQVGSKAASAGLGTISGGARGVDESSMRGAMNSGGAVVGILADSLLKASTSAKYRSGLMNGNVVLVSPFNPESGFNRFNAMDRNKYIYCLADTSLVVHSGAKGGTWEGAIQNLKKGWVPTWVKQTQDSAAGNAGIVAAGASWCSENIAELDVQSLLVSSANSNVNSLFSQPQADLFAQPNDEMPPRDSNDDLAEEDGSEKKTKNNEALLETKESVSPTKSEPEIVSKDSFYQLFVQYLQTVAIEPISESELVEVSDLHKGQVKIWLSLAQEQNLVTKLTRPVRYQWVDDNSK
ncbi:TPA: DNA-protecting protein DprA [Vibrio parahaemolyticus]|uniref:DNA-processing protein DprA n=1 Tax=Vibrio parahaemolyticus TaxID=670 RepID=UPI001124A903|nr:DNA-processing protein DprA [Vibrio parahaemolyticus]EGR3313365.1 DNA-processing protein DprA [Vibrio parahaemolyticus]MBX5341734.1 DNA-protecting protein DprA [Vibrio parahaemolyticus]MBX5351757.1 DNA-protecting protein DprA [Vibrio parahaemolyticus]MBX5356175.1 DNA-protecting protein DprA [Vibrio parahaemolyticus]MBX5365370.1 DNA-protecting protein DprA [Vibrio parahaemolyticus]